MSALTKNEREGLEEVFLSIHAKREKYEKIKEISALIISYKNSLNLHNLIKQAQKEFQEIKKPHYLLKLTKKKKNLSK